MLFIEVLKQYGPSKENRPNPIVEMGLFMDGDGIPLAFSIHSVNTNEQLTLQPLEKNPGGLLSCQVCGVYRCRPFFY
jgi:hypothetical protein